MESVAKELDGWLGAPTSATSQGNHERAFPAGDSGRMDPTKWLVDLVITLKRLFPSINWAMKIVVHINYIYI